MAYSGVTALGIANTVPGKAGGTKQEIAQRLVDYVAANYDPGGAPGITPCPMNQKDACTEAGKKVVPPAQFEAVVTKHGMLPEHAEKLRDCAKKEKFTVTFRDTSTDCAPWIEKKFPMKPPRIHEKSLSKKTVDDCLIDYDTGKPKYTPEEITKLMKLKGLGRLHTTGTSHARGEGHDSRTARIQRGTNHLTEGPPSA